MTGGHVILSAAKDLEIRDRGILRSFAVSAARDDVKDQ